jgi:hypothetical protein
VVKAVRVVGKVVVRVEASKEVKVENPAAAVPQVAKADPGAVRTMVREAGMSWGQEVR